MLSCSGTRMYDPDFKLGMEVRVGPGDVIENYSANGGVIEDASGSDVHILTEISYQRVHKLYC